MKYTCNFILDNRSGTDGKQKTENVRIYADISFKGRLRYVTGYRVDASRWVNIKKIDEETGKITRIQEVKKNCYGIRDGKSVAYNFINNDLKLIQSTLHEIFRDNQVVTKDMIILILDNKLKKTKNRVESEEEVDTSLWGLFSIFVQLPSVSPNRLRIYRNSYNTFKRFQDSRRRKISLEDCTPRLMDEFDEFMKNDDNSKGKYNYLPVPQRPRKKGSNTRIMIFNVLAKFFRWAGTSYGITVNPFDTYKIESEKYDAPICLTKADLDLLYDWIPTKEYLGRVRDLFYFQCCVGCRISDYLTLTKDNLTDDGTWLEYIPQKTIKDTSKSCRIQLTTKAQAILNKYDLPNGKLLPFISSQKYNDYIGELLKEAGINRKETIINRVTMKPEYKPLYEVVSSHTARKTFIDILMKTKAKESVIASMSGHSKGSRAFHRYYDVDDTQRQDAIKGLE